MIPFLTIFKREIRRFLKVFFQTVATPLISTALYLLIFGVSIGNRIGELHGVSYLAFLVPGLVMMATLRNAFDNSSGSIIVSKFCGELEDLKMAPLTPNQIVFGNALGSLVRGFIVGGLTFAVGAIFYAYNEGLTFPFAHPLALIFFLVLGALSFAHLGLALAMFAKTLEQITVINTFVLVPLIYLGGIFFSLEQMHPLWQTVSKVNPLLYFVSGIRWGILGISDVPIFLVFIVSVATWLSLYVLALIGLKRGSYQKW